MEQEKYPGSKQSNFWRVLERLAVIITLIASLATVVGLILQVRSQKRIIELQIISADQLTRLPSVSGLDGKFTYNNISVTDLWRLKIQFINTGDTTLIGEGTASSLIASTIPISFPSSVNILDASSEIGSFYKLTRSNTNTLDIEFSQWRSGEKFETIVYLVSNNVLNTPPMPTVASRPIINGDIQIIDLTAKNAIQPQPAIDYIPSPFALVGKILGGVIALTIGLSSFAWLVIVSPISYFRAQYWKYKYFDSFQKHLNNITPPEKQKKALLKNPWQPYPIFYPSHEIRLESSTVSTNAKVKKTNDTSELVAHSQPRFFSRDRIWKDFDGPTAPEPSFDTFLGTFIGFIIGIVLASSCAAILASMIII